MFTEIRLLLEIIKKKEAVTLDYLNQYFRFNGHNVTYKAL